MRYGQPRKLKTKRGLLKAMQNAWCLSCREPMARHGKNFTCSTCHLATRIQIGKGFGNRTQAIRRGLSKAVNERDNYPYCAWCRVRMHRFSRNANEKPHAFRCRQCKAMTASHRERSSSYAREKEIMELLQAGHLDSQIVRKMKCHRSTIKRLRAQVSEVRLCKCGQLFYHANKCEQRPGWQTVARERREAFDDLLVRINRRIPSTFPEEMRDEICQEMFLEVMKSIDRILANAPDFIKSYKKRYPFQYHSFDANPTLIERIAG